MRARRILIALSSLAVVAAGLTLTPSASADSVQVQSYQRTAQSQACAAQPGETPWEAAWGADSSWHPTWEQWANGGQGGWTCGRTIVWAKTIGCVQTVVDIDPGPAWSDFGSGYSLPFLSRVFSDGRCSEAIGWLPFDAVWAADVAQAHARCESVWPGTRANRADLATASLFACIAPD
jgi:hypothetical protein